MSEVYSIELKLDGTRLCVSLMHNGGWGSLEISGDSVDLAPLINAARADGMREAAVVVAHEGADIAASLAGEHGPCDKTAAAVTLNVADAILSAIGGQK